MKHCILPNAVLIKIYLDGLNNPFHHFPLLREDYVHLQEEGCVEDACESRNVGCCISMKLKSGQARE
eukprot:10225568-Ditylum_brightwellii.AAC.1